MTIFLIILAVLLLLTLFPLGLEARYNDRGLTVFAQIGPVWLRIYPREKKPQKSKPQVKTSPASPASPKGGALAPVTAYFPLLAPALSSIKRRLTIRELTLRLLVAAPSPADAALAYGGANAFLGTFLTVMRENFRLQDYHLTCDVDFGQTASTCVLDLIVRLRLWQIFAIVLPLLVRFVKITEEYKQSHPTTKETR